MIELSGAARRLRRHRESIELVCLLWYCSGAALSITGDFDIVPSVPKGTYLSSKNPSHLRHCPPHSQRSVIQFGDSKPSFCFLVFLQGDGTDYTEYNVFARYV